MNTTDASFVCPTDLDDDSCQPSGYGYSRSDECTFVDECCDDFLDSIINYINIQYCTFNNNNIEWVGIIILIIFCIYYFMFLDKIADDYFAPVLKRIAKYLNISSELAGVTLLAIGNGADDISASVYAILIGGNSTKLALGELLGVAVINLSVINGVITYVTYKYTASYPIVNLTYLIRDLGFLALIIVLVLSILLFNQVHIVQSLSFFVIYVVYVGVVLIHEGFCKRKNLDNSNETLPVKLNENDIQNSFKENLISDGKVEDPGDETASNSSSDSSDSSIDLDKIKEKSMILYYIVIILKFPVIIIDYIYWISVPSVDDKKWNDIRSIICCITSPFVFMYGFDLFDDFGDIQIWIVIALSIMVAIFVGYKIYQRNKASNESKNKPVFRGLFLFLGFISGFAWIGMIADELVSVLTVIGVTTTIDLTLLGLTVLAWGNSVGDIITDSSVAKVAEPNMALHGSISAPTVNISMGLGIATLIKTFNADNYTYYIPSDSILFLTIITTFIQIISTLVIVFIFKKQLTKFYIYFSFVTYAVFMIAIVIMYLLYSI